MAAQKPLKLFVEVQNLSPVPGHKRAACAAEPPNGICHAARRERYPGPSENKKVVIFIETIKGP